MTKAEKIAVLYRTYGNMDVVASSLGISLRSVFQTLHRVGEPILHAFGEQASTNRQYHQHGCVATWIRDHRHQRLPKDREGITRTTGCSLRAVDTYMSRRRLKCANMRKDLPDLRKKNILLCSKRPEERDVYFVSGALEEYKTYIHPATFVVFLTGVLHSREEVFVEIPLEKIWERIEEQEHGR